MGSGTTLSTASMSSMSFRRLRVAFERLQRRHRARPARRRPGTRTRRAARDLQLDELEHLLVVDQVDLVQRHDDAGTPTWRASRTCSRVCGIGPSVPRPRGWRRPSAPPGDHVLDVVGMTRAVDVRVVARRGLVLGVRDRDRDTALPLLRRLVDLLERREGGGPGTAVQHLRDRRRQRRLAVVDVTDGADVDVRLSPLELRLGHCGPPRTYRVTRHGECGPVGRSGGS